MTSEVTCSHQDASRSNVSRTAFAVALMRGMESKQANPLYVDPYAEELAGEFTWVTMENQINEWRNTASRRTKEGLLNLVSTRTKIIDDFILQNLRDGSTEQIMVFGAGLDTRAWRLKLDKSQLKHVSYFEIDFPEIFNYKLPILERLGAISDFNYHTITADLSLPNWPEVVEKSGFDRTKKTLYLMEGFANYLKEEELTPLMTTVAALGPPGGCKLIGTFNSAASQESINLHRFWPENPLEYIQKFGWVGSQEDIEDLATTLGRKSAEGEERRGYYIIKAIK